MLTNPDIQITRERVVCYITRHAHELLVFDHDNSSLSNGLNPVAGGVDPGESIHTAALRETFEESGLALESAVHLESRIIQGKNGSYQRWHFMWLEVNDAPDAWNHHVTGVGERDHGKVYAHRFVPMDGFIFSDDRLNLAFPLLREALSARQKAVCYITRGTDILVFDHTPEHPTAGTQVPSGGLEPDETPAQAATREAFEETGLEGLSAPAYLGSKLYKNGLMVQVWHFYHLVITNQSTIRRGEVSLAPMTKIPDAWAQNADEHIFLHRFEPVSSAVIHYGFEVMLPELQTRLGLPITPSRNIMRSSAACYITRDVRIGNVVRRELLVFEGHPGGGVQIVAGGIDEGETFEQTAIREAWEEAGLRLESPRFLGTHEYHFKGKHPFKDRPLEFHELRYFYHFHVTEPRDAWTHMVSAGDYDSGFIFAHRFVGLNEVQLDWELGEFVPLIGLENGGEHA